MSRDSRRGHFRVTPVRGRWDRVRLSIPVIGVSAAGRLADVEYSFRKPLRYDEFLKAVKLYVGK